MQPLTVQEVSWLSQSPATVINGEIHSHSLVRDRDPDHGRGPSRCRERDHGHPDPSHDHAGTRDIPAQHSRSYTATPSSRRSNRRSPNIHPPTSNRGPDTAAVSRQQPTEPAGNTRERPLRFRLKNVSRQTANHRPAASTEAISFSFLLPPVAALKCTLCASAQLVQNA